MLTMLAMATVASARTTPFGSAEPTGPLPLCNTVYVSPDLAIGNNSNPGTMKEPFLNIQNAIWEASLHIPAVVVLLPGTYSPSTNGEYFPINMELDVSIQGTSAMNTVLDGESYNSDLINFRPWLQGPQGSFDETYVDSITLRRGYSAINMDSEFDPIGATISNCFITDNVNGIRMYAIWHYGEQMYPHHNPKIVNNTIVENTIGILDDTKILLDPYNGPYDGKGVAEPALINNIILFNSLLDLQGTDSTDVKNCAFVTQNPNKVVGLLPSTWFWSGSLTLFDTFVNSYHGDYRLLPETLVEDMGTNELFVENGTTVEPISPCGMEIFDFDGEGYGNERLVDAVDLGADERSDLIIAGYIPWTTKFGQSYDTMHINVAPKTFFGSMLDIRLWFAKGAPRWNKLGTAPGARAKGSAHMTLTSNFGKLWLQRNANLSSHAVHVQANTWFYLPVQQSASPCHWNVQSMSKGATGNSDLSNLQSFLAE